MGFIQKRYSGLFVVVFVALAFNILLTAPSVSQNMKAPLVICTAMGAKTIYMPSSNAVASNRKHCPLCLLFANSPLCLFVMKLIV